MSHSSGFFNYGSSSSYTPYTVPSVSYSDLVSKPKSNIHKLFNSKKANYEEVMTEAEPFETLAPKPSKSFKFMRRMLFLLFIVGLVFLVITLIGNL